MQVIRINTWLCADDALKMIELLDALRDALAQEHHQGIAEIMQNHAKQSAVVARDRRQLELPIDTGPPF